MKHIYSANFLFIFAVNALFFSAPSYAQGTPSILLLNSKQATCPFKMYGNRLQVDVGGGVQFYQDSSTNLETTSCISSETAISGLAGGGLANIMMSRNITDPLANLSAPTPGPAKTVPGCTDKQNVYVVNANNASACSTIPAGYYPGGIVVDNENANVIMAGTYILGKNGFVVKHGSVDGTGGVLIYIMSDSSGSPKIDVTTGKTINLNGMVSGPYAGIIFYQDRNNNNDVKFNDDGTGAITLAGSIYAPTAKIAANVQSNFIYGTTNGIYPGIIANTIEYSGSGIVKTESIIDPKVIDQFLRGQFSYFPAELSKHAFANCQLATGPSSDTCVCTTSFISKKTKNMTNYTLTLEQYNQGRLVSPVRVSVTQLDTQTNTSVTATQFGTKPIALKSLKVWCTKDKVISIP